MDAPLFGGESKSAIERKRKLAEALMYGATDSSPVGHWTGALARGLQGVAGGVMGSMADRSDTDRRRAMAEALVGKTPDEIETMGIEYDEPDLIEIAQRRRKSSEPGANEYGLQPVWAKDADGNWQLYQPSRGGGSPLQMQFPEGVSPQPNVTYHDTGMGFVPTETKGGAVSGATIPKDVEAEAAAAETGKTSVTLANAAQGDLPMLDHTVKSLGRAMELLDEKATSQPYEGMGSSAATWVGTNLPDVGIVDQGRAKASYELQQILSLESINQMAASLKGVTTDFELGEFKKILADPNAPNSIKVQTVRRMMELAEAQQGLARNRAGVSQPETDGPPVPQVGMVMDGFVFQGGDPADPSSWRRQ